MILSKIMFNTLENLTLLQTFEVLHFKTVLDKRAIELSPPELELFTAIRCEDIEVLQNTLKTQSVKLNIRDDTGHTFLGVAASTGFLDGVRTLLEVCVSWLYLLQFGKVFRDLEKQTQLTLKQTLPVTFCLFNHWAFNTDTLLDFDQMRICPGNIIV